MQSIKQGSLQVTVTPINNQKKSIRWSCLVLHSPRTSQIFPNDQLHHDYLNFSSLSGTSLLLIMVPKVSQRVALDTMLLPLQLWVWCKWANTLGQYLKKYNHRSPYSCTCPIHLINTGLRILACTEGWHAMVWECHSS
jgi:hypothetical protein